MIGSSTVSHALSWRLSFSDAAQYSDKDSKKRDDFLASGEALGLRCIYIGMTGIGNQTGTSSVLVA